MVIVYYLIDYGTIPVWYRRSAGRLRLHGRALLLSGGGATAPRYREGKCTGFPNVRALIITIGFWRFLEV